MTLVIKMQKTLVTFSLTNAKSEGIYAKSEGIFHILLEVN